MPQAEPIIRAENLRKRFRAANRHSSLRDLIAGLASRRRATNEPANRSFWAVDGVSFVIRPGEALGVIGPNGAGKSTLLKLMAGILRPDGGTLDISGRVSALIELGAGFHPDLSGRENIHLNGAILGMPRRAINRRFDDIVAFAEIADALDEPVKRYSSGMQARLGFAIAAHLDAPVLLVDEVLSVGDRAFRTRCLDRMYAARAAGAAVVFVSHDLETVRRFCSSVLVLVAGRPAFHGPPAEAVARYRDLASASIRLSTDDGRPAAIVINSRIVDVSGRVVHAAGPGQTLTFEYSVSFNLPVPAPSFGFSLISLADQTTLYETSSSRQDLAFAPAQAGETRSVRCAFELNVPPGRYAIGLHVRDRDASLYAVEQSHAIELEVVGPPPGGCVFLDPHIEVDANPQRPQFDVEIPKALQPVGLF